MLRIPPREFLAHLRIEPLPEPSQVASHLHRPVVRREKMHHHGRAADLRRLAHSEKILQSRFDPGRLAGFVVNLDLAAAREPKTVGSSVNKVRWTNRVQDI